MCSQRLPMAVSGGMANYLQKEINQGPVVLSQRDKRAIRDSAAGDLRHKRWVVERGTASGRNPE